MASTNSKPSRSGTGIQKNKSRMGSRAPSKRIALARGLRSTVDLAEERRKNRCSKRDRKSRNSSSSDDQDQILSIDSSAEPNHRDPRFMVR